MHFVCSLFIHRQSRSPCLHNIIPLPLGLRDLRLQTRELKTTLHLLRPLQQPRPSSPLILRRQVSKLNRAILHRPRSRTMNSRPLLKTSLRRLVHRSSSRHRPGRKQTTFLPLGPPTSKIIPHPRSNSSSNRLRNSSMVPLPRHRLPRRRRLSRILDSSSSRTCRLSQDRRRP